MHDLRRQLPIHGIIPCSFHAHSIMIMCPSCSWFMWLESYVVDMTRDSDYGAFMEKFLIQPSPSHHELPLNALTFSVKDM